jgi:hypothetical protein
METRIRIELDENELRKYFDDAIREAKKNNKNGALQKARFAYFFDELIDIQ